MLVAGVPVVLAPHRTLTAGRAAAHTGTGAASTIGAHLTGQLTAGVDDHNG